jgi:DNA invertase Pin-like site-specific DNA recombinase
MKYGYARVSTEEQNADLQRDALKLAGCKKIIVEKVSGASAKRPKLEKLLAKLQSDDVLIVWRLDRLGRNMDHLRDTINWFGVNNIGFQSLNEAIDTTTANGELIFNIFASLAQFERERIAERTKEGLEAAKARGRVGGRPPALTTAQKAEVRRMRDGEQRAISEIARLFKVSERTVRRA